MANFSADEYFLDIGYTTNIGAVVCLCVAVVSCLVIQNIIFLLLLLVS